MDWEKMGGANLNCSGMNERGKMGRAMWRWGTVMRLGGEREREERQAEGRQHLLTAELLIDKVTALQLDTSTSHHAPTHTSWVSLLRAFTHSASQAVALLMTHTHTHIQLSDMLSLNNNLIKDFFFPPLFSLFCLWGWRLSSGRKLKGTPVTEDRTLLLLNWDSKKQSKKAAVGSVDSAETTG